MTEAGSRVRGAVRRAWPARLLAGVVLTVSLVVAAGGCSNAPANSPSSASTCEQLAKGSAQLTRTIVRDLQGKTEADLRATNPAEPFAELLRPYDAYRARAAELGCDLVQLRRLSCEEYQDIEPNGPVAEEFLARVPDTCR